MSRPVRTPLRTIDVDLGARSYSICIGGGPDLRGAARAIAQRHDAGSAAIITDSCVAPLYLDRLRQDLEAEGLHVHAIVLPSGESQKSLEVAERLFEELAVLELDRSCPIVALGGGVVGDLAGFVAANFLRGVPLAHVPTTVVAQVDSAIGGKTAVNLRAGKNLVGAFHQPSMVWVDVSTLGSLPDKHRRAGLAEVVKYGAIRDGDLFARIEKGIGWVQSAEPKTLVPMISRCCEIKARIVERDETDHGERLLLNFGHTLGHAVEVIAGYGEWLHGEAVAAGMVYAAGLSRRLGLCSGEVPDRLEKVIGRLGLPKRLPPAPLALYREAIGADKKRLGGKLRFVVLRELGRAEIAEMDPEEILKDLESALDCRPPRP